MVEVFIGLQTDLEVGLGSRDSAGLQKYLDCEWWVLSQVGPETAVSYRVINWLGEWVDPNLAVTHRRPD